MTNRRTVIGGLAALAACGGALPPRRVFAAAQAPMLETSGMRGSIDAGDFGIRPGALDDQSRAFDRILKKAGETGQPIFLPPGRYTVSNLTLPKRINIIGAPGATRIVYGGNGRLLAAEGCERVELRGLVIDGANRWLEACAGSIEGNRISGAADAGLYSVQATGLRISGNAIADCGNGGILVHRWQEGPDGTIVTGNRIERIQALSGGTGQNGNGINVFRTANVIVANNVVSHAAFSAIRANAGNNIQIIGNNCTASGETALYSEFGFEGAVVANNVVDGAANGIALVNFNEGGRLGTCSGNVVRNLRIDGPYRRPARLRRRHQRRGRDSGHRKRRRERAPLRHQDRLGSLHAQRHGDGKRHPPGGHRHLCDGCRRHRTRRHHRQRDPGRRAWRRGGISLDGCRHGRPVATGCERLCPAPYRA